METNRSFLGQFFSTPPITRMLSISIIAVIVGVYIKLVSPYMLMYSPLFLRKGEIWRICTCFLYFGRPSLDVLIHITFLYRYSRMLEEGFINTSDYFWLVTIISSILFAIANIFNIPLLASAFSSTITYIWTRRNPHALVQIFGFISFPAFYLPFIVPLFMLITEKRILTEDLLGIVVGHLYFFFKDVYPKWGSDIFRTPCFIKKLFGEHSEDCCKKKKYRTLNLNSMQPVPAMETILIDETINNSATIVENTGVVESNASMVVENTNINTTVNSCTVENVSSDSLHFEESNESIPPLDTSVNMTEKSIQNTTEASLEIGDEKINKFLEEKSKQDKDWEETWSSESE
ncbi:Derlin-2 [Nosema granulosis]|uniref:Derlin n=1 Tax=Nosema granulosis TaxID=83296 RepID=A0A9P6GV74_9MICR|nr:Derlin-2 [Nosema granulosis]